MKKRTRGNPIPLIVEDHPFDYDGYPFITLIQYRNEHYLTLIDNADKKTIKSYILDLCGPATVDEQQIIEVAQRWWYMEKDRYPLSFAFSKAGMANEVSKIYRSYNIEYVTRVIGPLPKFEMHETTSVKRRKRKTVPKTMKISKVVPIK